MAQTPCKKVGAGMSLDYTPGSALAAGKVVIIGVTPMIAELDVASGELGALANTGLWDIPKITGAIAQGDAVYWDADADPVGGTAGSGAATTTAAGNTMLGIASAAAASGDEMVRVLLMPANRSVVPSIPTATVAAAGTNQATAAAISTGFTLVTGADDAKGVKLPAAVAGNVCIIKVGPGADLLVYPNTDDAINGIAANSPMTVVDDVCFMLIAHDETTYYTLPLLPS